MGGPMTAQIEGDRGPIWFFTATDNSLVIRAAGGGRAIAASMFFGADQKADYQENVARVELR
jgi:hypothetical protein